MEVYHWERVLSRRFKLGGRLFAAGQVKIVASSCPLGKNISQVLGGVVAKSCE